MTDLLVFTPTEAMDAAFAGEPAHLIDGSGGAEPLAVHVWTNDADAVDRDLFVRPCTGPTIDVGCGPGRLTEALGHSSVHAMGVDISAEAVRQTRSRGAAAICRDVFAHMPGAGLWEHALLADGNVGIGGDPVRLLRRVHDLVQPGGTIIAELARPGIGVVRERVRLRVGERLSGPFVWAHVGIDAIGEVADAAGLCVRDLRCVAGRYVAVLTHLDGA